MTTFTAGKDPVAGWAAVAATHRDIGGVTFQQVKPYVLAASPRRDLPDLVVWLRKVRVTAEREVWSATIVRGTTRLSEHRSRSATGAVTAVMADTLWAEAPAPAITLHTPELTPDHLYPPSYRHTPAGWYPERPSAHDRRWDTRRGIA